MINILWVVGVCDNRISTEQTYNAQAAVDDQTMLVVATGVSQAPNDKEQVIPMLETLQAQGTTLGPIEALVADTGYCSEKNVEGLPHSLRWPEKNTIPTGGNGIQNRKPSPKMRPACRR